MANARGGQGRGGRSGRERRGSHAAGGGGGAGGGAGVEACVTVWWAGVKAGVGRQIERGVRHGTCARAPLNCSSGGQGMG